ncbi:TPA: helix-turn-helix domain-containing protein [Escherichia coli]|jgi:HTH-type transcriptional regulator/antitoxin HigA|uniref:helix-turn-helix domain-containing protein n=1 Tax=Enterobacteriaceae TaxID=543 RepID=UPI0002A3FCF0|nr:MULTISPECIES: helix-turn-helix domain-containing protein [Enterobacteriaceae]EGD8759154.1 transcriptional regulator [Shigella flexneri]EGF2700160.1 transcriptional regulator [Shigella sonnei]HAK6362424.1 helix-turn-helix domain-containing protein [Salmonella enterica]AXE71541.1 transcriptional regulator [Escherichia coli]EEC7290294.1 helix-turn-helix domain-containing protein [Escherichia coli]
MDKNKINEGLHLLTGELPWLEKIQNDRDYKDALTTLEQLSSDDSSHTLLLKIIANSIAEYEHTRIPAILYQHDGEINHGLDALITLMDHDKIKGKDMARILEISPALMSSILSGKRALTIPHICKLAEYFRVSRSVFI